MTRNTSQQYWYSLTTLVYALVVIGGSYWHYCGQVACDSPSYHPVQEITSVANEDSNASLFDGSDASYLQEQSICFACLLSELRQIDSSPSYELQTTSVNAGCNLSSRLFVVAQSPNLITARGPPQLMIS